MASYLGSQRWEQELLWYVHYQFHPLTKKSSSISWIHNLFPSFDHRFTFKSDRSIFWKSIYWKSFTDFQPNENGRGAGDLQQLFKEARRYTVNQHNITHCINRQCQQASGNIQYEKTWMILLAITAKFNIRSVRLLRNSGVDTVWLLSRSWWSKSAIATRSRDYKSLSQTSKLLSCKSRATISNNLQIKAVQHHSFMRTCTSSNLHDWSSQRPTSIMNHIIQR